MDEIAAAGPVEIMATGSELPLTQHPRVNTAPEMHLAFERTLTIDGFPVLQSHVMNNRAVLPLAIIAEWLAIGAMHNNPGLAYLGFEDLRTLRGVVLENGEQIDLRIMAGTIVREGDHHCVPVELQSAGIPYARARIILGEDFKPPPAVVDTGVITGAYPRREIYAHGHLFHGPSLQGITAIDACSEAGISARVRTAPAPSDWVVSPIRTAWLGDPLVMDCAFQLMILWSMEQTGNGSLPTRVGRYRQFQRTHSADEVIVTALVRRVSENSAAADIYFRAMDGQYLAVIEDYGCVIDASLNDAFRRNKLQVSSAT